jgi:hypothetical protein
VRLLLLILVRFQLVIERLELLALLVGASATALAHLHHILRLLPCCALEKVKLILLLVHCDLGRKPIV